MYVRRSSRSTAIRPWCGTRSSRCRCRVSWECRTSAYRNFCGAYNRGPALWEQACRPVIFVAWKMMRPRWWAGWRENAIQQSEEMPRVRACDEEERADRQGRPAVEMPGLPVELDDAAAAAQAGADAGGVPSWLLGPSSQRAADSAGDARALRKRIAWCWRIRPRIAPPDARRHTVMADGTYMGHGWCLIIAIDGQTGEVLDRQWCAHESKAAYLALFSRLPAPDVLITDGLRGAEAACTQAWPGTRIQRCLVHVQRNTRTGLTSRPRLQPGCLCSISCCGFSHDDFSGLGRACRPRNGLNWMVLVSPPERTGKDYDQHAPSTVYPSFAAERGIRRVDRAENTCQRADGA